MRGTFIFDQLNDVVFVKVDKSLEEHLQNLFIREGLTQASSPNGETPKLPSKLDTNALIQLFSPLVTSQRIMLNQFNNPYTAIHAQDGTIMTFAKRLGFLFIAMGSEKEESLAIIQKRLHIFVRLVNSLCGPVINLLKSFNPGAAERQRMLNSLLDKWEELRKEELSFQIEAVERLLVNEYLSGTCLNLLEIVLDKIRSLGREYHYPAHAFLLVNTKLLTLYSSRKAGELTASDILLLAMLAHTHHPTCRFELPRSPRHSPSPSTSCSSPQESSFPPIPIGSTLTVPRLSISSSEPDDALAPEKVFAMTPPEKVFAMTPPEKVLAMTPPEKVFAMTPPEKVLAMTPPEKVLAMTPPEKVLAMTPPEKVLAMTPPSDSHRFLTVPLYSESEESSDNESFYSPCGSPAHFTIERGISNLAITVTDTNLNCAVDCEIETHAHDDILDEGITWHAETPFADITHDVVFLNAERCPLTPHTLHTIKIMDGVVLVLVCDSGKGLIAASVVQTLSILHDNQVAKQHELAKQHLESLESSMKRLIDITKKASTADDDRLMRNLMNRWDVVKRNGLADFLKSTTTRFMTSKLESAVTALMEIIQEVFQKFCLPEKSVFIPITPDATNVLVGIQAYLRYNLADYGDYLRIKALRNVTLSSYINDFPGLVHFIYVNRATNQVVVPVVDESLVIKDIDLRKTIKSKVSRMVEFTRTQLQCGHFAILWRDSHFSYSYFLWFEDLKGEPLKPHVLLQGLRNYPSPGIICGDFYKLLRSECFPDAVYDNIQCFELLCIHLVEAAPVNLANYVRKLVSVVWEMTGGNASPYHLL